MSNKGIVIAVLALAIAVGTYFVLEQMYPHEVEEAKADTGVTVEQVFAGTLQPAPATEVATAPEEPAVPAEPAPAATEPAPSELAPAEPTATEPEPMPATEPEPAAEPEPAPEPPPAPEPKVQPEPEPEPAPAVEPPPPPKPKAPPAKPKAPVKQAPAVPAKPWWGPERADRLSLVYAGSAAYKRAVVLMFNGTFDSATSANQNLQVKDSAGKAVAGTWELGASNKRMLLFPVRKAGIYTVAVKPGLADARGRTVAAAMQGPVQVQ